MEIFVRDAESETGKWRSVLVNVSVCLLTVVVRYRNVIITFAPLGVVFGCMKTPNSTTLFHNSSNFWVDIPILHFNSLCREY